MARALGTPRTDYSAPVSARAYAFLYLQTAANYRQARNVGTARTFVQDARRERRMSALGFAFRLPA